MSKNKDKKAKEVKEVKEEIKTPSAEVSENGAEVETKKDESGVEYVECKKQKTMIDLAGELKLNIEELKDFDNGHHNKLVIDLTVDGALAVINDLITKLEFIEKASSEKKK